MDVVVVATFEDFDETLDKRLRGPGLGRKHACHALLRHLAAQASEDIARVDLLILDWKTPPKGSAKEVKVALWRGGGAEQLGHWGSRDQLLTKFPSSVWDVAICAHTRRFVLDFAGQLKVRRRAALAHSYDLPLGPWGQEQTAEQLAEHAAICEKFELLCTSRHLTEFVEKWGEGRFPARCCYTADFNYFDPVPGPLSPWEDSHQHVTFVSPCPEKGLSIFIGLAQSMPQTQFLAVKTVAWTKPWHEQLLKKFANVKLQAAVESIDAVLRLTRVLVVPSVGQEAFSSLAVEAQLRGVPVISTDAYGLPEANRVQRHVVADVPIVYDQRTHELVLGMTLAEAEASLSADRAGALTMEQARQTVVNQENYQKVADDNDVERFRAVLRSLLEGGESTLRQASQDARLASHSFVDSRRNQLLPLLRKLLEEHAAAGDAKPAPAIAAFSSSAAPRGAGKPRVRSEAEAEEEDFDVHQDFTKAENFDGMTLAARCLVRLCESGNLTVAAELIQAKADVNMPEPDIGVTPLIGAANAGHLDICKFLFRKEADVNSVVRDGTERTALHASSQMGFASVVQLLLERRANPRVEDLTKTTPLVLAVRYGHAGATDLLLQYKANPNQSDDQGQVAINDAVAKDRFDLVTKLLEHGALVNVRNMAGLEAISFSRTPQMQSLIMKHDVNF